MPYNQNIPLGRDRFYVSQGDMLQNFQQIDIDTQIDHVFLNSVNQGKHNFLHFPNGTVNAEVDTTNPTPGIPLVSNRADFSSNAIQSVEHCTLRIQEKAASFNAVDPFRINTESDTITSTTLPSGLLVKTFRKVRFSLTVGTPGVIAEFPINEIGIPFSQVYWAQAYPRREPSSDATDPNTIVYIQSISNTMVVLRYHNRVTSGELTRPFNVLDLNEINLVVFGRR